MDDEFLEAVQNLVRYFEGGVIELTDESAHLQYWQIPEDLQDLLTEVRDFLEEME